MNCLRCASPMYRVVNQDKSAKATCSRCSQWTDCARCSGPTCGDTRCLGCYNKAVSAAGKPTQIRSEPIISDEEPV